MTQPAEGGDDFICDEEDFVLAADVTDAFEVALRRHDDAARCHDGFSHKGRNIFRAMISNRLFEFRDQMVGKNSHIHCFRSPEGIRVGQFYEQIVCIVHPVPVSLAAVERGRKIGAAMIAAFSAQDLLL